MLAGDQFGALLKVLKDAFPKIFKLQMMVRVQLSKNLNEVAGGNDLDEVLYNLITTAESEGWMEELIKKAHQYSPDNSQLKNFYDEYFSNSPVISLEKRTPCPSSQKLEQEQATTKLPHMLLNPCKFDLSELIRRCLNVLEEKHGIVGLAVSYNQDPFLKYFCERLRDRLGKSNIDCRDALTLDYRTPVDKAVSIIKRYKPLLQTHDVICPIRVQVSEPNSSHEFWHKISAEFKEKFEHRLIIIMVSSERKFFPQGVIQISSPKFTKADAHNWILDVTKALGWEEQVIEKWKYLMKSECLQSDTNNELLDIRYVYEHLDYAINLLQKSPSADAFLETLEQRIQAYD